MKKGIFAAIFIALMCVMGGASIVTFLRLHWPESVPEEKEEEMEVPAVGTVIGPQSSGGLLKTVEYAKAGVEAYAKSVNPLSNLFSGISGWYNEFVQGDLILNGGGVLLRLSNGYYTSPFPYSHPVDIWNGLLDFSTWLQPKGIKFFHLILADKGDDSFGTLPDGAPDGYARMAGEYKAFLEENGIDYLEAKSKLLAHDSDFYNWFYKADHRMNVQSGLILAEESAKKLESLGVQADTDMIRKDNFTRVVYPNSFRGSLSRNLGPGHKEDLEVFYPKMETCFRVQIPNNGIVKSGSFDNTHIRKQYLSPGDASLSAFYGDSQITNMLSDNQTRVLVIGRCKKDVICAYLSLSVRYVDMITPGSFDGSIRSYIERTNPDAVILCIDVPWEGGEKYFDLK